MLKRRIQTIALGMVVTTILLGYYMAAAPNVLINDHDQEVTIAKGMDYPALEQLLYDKGYLRHRFTFRLMAYALRYPQRLLPGVYQLQTDMSNWQAVRLLRSGAQKPVRLVLTQAKDKLELTHHLTRYTAMEARELEALLNDGDWVASYGFTVENVMAMFIPNTYEIYWTFTPQQLFKRLYKEYQSFWNTHRRQQAQQLVLTPIEVAILASIVQRETCKLEEAPVIAGVYLNRLKRGMPLQSCATLLYALDDPSIRRVIHKYQRLSSPYNTYQRKGLPPGPITLPSIAMIDAVLHPASHPYLYFSAKEDFSGYHYFTSSYQAHLKHARRYQKALDQARIYR